ncbi:MAG: Asp-tRNA(Asn)/Glu-tRNA(Gln) amidotransferase subunit GatA [Candidatus Gastranaerophilales bacterium]|nr:Asp-tRNA(Asn)/Glu-tRNA(Gln) amidotransferase subunit GatA [Candidatus Gastranaerophilales bacterium]
MFKTATEAQEALLSKKISAKELVDFSYKTIEEQEPKVEALNALTKELAYETAKNVDEKIAKGDKLPLLAGVPLIIKDNICVKNTLTTASSKMLENFVSPYSATVANKLEENLIPVVAKANMDEFAMGSSTENSAFKITKNPHNTTKVPGGSSGGSAAAVAAGEALLSLGSDTGGSIRLPASFCGIFGLKPSYGRVSRYGLIAFASSLDQIGPFARSTKDIAMLLEVISGYDKNDSTSINTPVGEYSKNLTSDLKGLKIGVITELLAEGVQDEVKVAVESTIKLYESLGAAIVPVSLPHVKYAIGTYYIIATAEASSNLARYDGVRYTYRAKDTESLIEMFTKTRSEAFGDEVKRRIMLGTYALSSGYYDAYYKKAQQIRSLIKQDYDKAFEQADVLLSPTCPTTAFDLNSKISDPLSMYLMDIGTITANLAGVAAMSVPCGFDKENMPIGLQLTANVLEEQKLLNFAYSYEQATNAEFVKFL